MSRFAKTFFDRDELGSTSDFARELVTMGEFALPLVVRARRQTSGRGQGENRWWSDDGSLTFTAAIDPHTYGLKREHEPCVAMAVAVGLMEVVESTLGWDRVLGLRWPNDVESKAGRKVGGILPERVETAEGPRLLIGMGLNVTTNFDQAPVEVARMATSLEGIAGRRLDGVMEGLFDAILGRLASILERLGSSDPLLSQAWSRRDLLQGSLIRLAIGPSLIEGMAMGIDPSGGLLVATDRGISTFHAGRVLREVT